MVPTIDFGEARANRARPTGNTFANPMLLRISNPSTQPTLSLCVGVETSAAPASESSASALKPSPIAILMTSLGSLKRFAHTRQNATAATRQETLTTESSVISHVVGIVRPKKTRLTLLGTHSI